MPQGSIVEQKNKNRARVKVAVFFVLAIHAVGLLALLMQGCRRDQPTTETEAPTNAPYAEPAFTNTNPVVAPDTNIVAPVATNPAPVEPAPVPPTPPTAAAQDYKVVKGDNYTVIGKRFGVSVKQLTEANPGVDPAKLRIGQTLHIPAPTPAAAATRTTAAGTETASDIYVVKSGDNLINIAKRFNTTVKAIQSANNLSTTSIKVGQKLKIPGKAASAPVAAPADTAVPPAPTTPQ